MLWILNFNEIRITTTIIEMEVIFVQNWFKEAVLSDGCKARGTKKKKLMSEFERMNFLLNKIIELVIKTYQNFKLKKDSIWFYLLCFLRFRTLENRR